MALRNPPQGGGGSSLSVMDRTVVPGGTAGNSGLLPTRKSLRAWGVLRAVDAGAAGDRIDLRGPVVVRAAGPDGGAKATFNVGASGSASYNTLTDPDGQLSIVTGAGHAFLATAIRCSHVGRYRGYALSADQGPDFNRPATQEPTVGSILFEVVVTAALVGVDIFFPPPGVLLHALDEAGSFGVFGVDGAPANTTVNAQFSGLRLA